MSDAWSHLTWNVPRAAIHTIQWHKQQSPFYHNTKTDSHTLKGVVRIFSFSLSWLPGMHEWRDGLLLFLSPHEPSMKMWLSMASYTTNGEETQSAQT